MVLREGLYIRNGQRTEENYSQVNRLLPLRAPMFHSLAAVGRELSFPQVPGAAEAVAARLLVQLQIGDLFTPR